MYVTGSHLAAQRFTTQVAGATRLPAQSDYISQAYGQRLGNDAEMIARVTQILDLAAQREQSAVRQAQLDSLSVRLEEFELKNPYVQVTVTGEGSLRRFTLHPVANFTTEFAPDSVPPAVSSEVQRELKQVSCAKISSCPSQGQSTSLAFYDFFQKNYVLLPFLVGVLMGIGIGGLFARSLLTAGIAASIISMSVKRDMSFPADIFSVSVMADIAGAKLQQFTQTRGPSGGQQGPKLSQGALRPPAYRE